ncbi:MAG TPA: GMC oxidoreductase [Longimicrobiales bacterium]
MSRVVVVGSGASGVHFALSLLRKGLDVTMIDVGRGGTHDIAPHANFTALKRELDDPAGYFLGERYEGVLLPGSAGEYYGIPPSKGYVFTGPDDLRHAGTGFEPLLSFARGGLAEAWTAGCYPLNEGETADFPFCHQQIAEQYEEVARRIGITGAEDDLAPFMPLHGHLLPPLRLDAHSEQLLAVYDRKRARLNRGLGVYMGRTRVATLTRALGSRGACEYLGRCLWGCPVGALYTPSHTLAECQTFDGFEYVTGARVEYFTTGAGNRVRSVVVQPVGGGAHQEIAVDYLALAAGTLMSSSIVLESVLRSTGERVELHGLMDNRQVLVPFFNLRMLGRSASPDTYQYHLLGLGLPASDPREYVHAQLTTLKTALLHPIIQRLPLDLQTATYLTRVVRAGLGVVNVNFRDTRRAQNYLTLSAGSGAGGRTLELHYCPDADEGVRMRDALRKIAAALRALGCIIPPGMTHVRPMGASVHYAGTLPMSREAAPFTTTEHCQSRDYPNLFIVDGSTFPFLPAKNITFTLMANAVRVAEAAF